MAAPCPKLLDKYLGITSPAAAAQGQLMWALGTKNHSPPHPACPSWSQWGENAGAGGEIPTEGLGGRLGLPSVGHQTPGSSQCQYWGELGGSTPLEDPMLQPGTPERGSAKLLLLSGRGRKGTGCWAILLLPQGNTGPPPHSCPTRLGLPRFPFPHWHCPRRTRVLATAQFSSLG